MASHQPRLARTAVLSVRGWCAAGALAADEASEGMYDFVLEAGNLRPGCSVYNLFSAFPKREHSPNRGRGFLSPQEAPADSGPEKV
jgi:hypothetical protein